MYVVTIRKYIHTYIHTVEPGNVTLKNKDTCIPYTVEQNLKY